MRGTRFLLRNFHEGFRCSGSCGGSAEHIAEDAYQLGQSICYYPESQNQGTVEGLERDWGTLILSIGRVATDNFEVEVQCSNKIFSLCSHSDQVTF